MPISSFQRTLSPHNLRKPRQLQFSGNSAESPVKAPVTVSAEEFARLQRIEKEHQRTTNKLGLISTFGGVSIFSGSVLGLAFSHSTPVLVTSLGIGIATAAYSHVPQAKLMMLQIAGAGKQLASGVWQNLQNRLK